MNWSSRVEERLKKLEDRVFATEVVVDAVVDKVVIPPVVEVKPEEKASKKAKE